jgi:hypothetical protein
VVELQAAVERVESAPGEGVFIKASSRSAKDAPTSQDRLGDLYHGLLAAAPDCGERRRGRRGHSRRSPSTANLCAGRAWW